MFKVNKKKQNVFPRMAWKIMDYVMRIAFAVISTVANENKLE